MKKSPEISHVLPFYLFTAGVFLLIVFKDLFSNGMFLDGTIYSDVSKNLANGSGTFWNPHFTATCIPDFHEHPPLAIGIQSLFFTLFGETRYVDRIYSLMTVIISGLIILKIWKTLGYKNGWIPLLIWILTPTVFWASYNNLLENTLTIFTSLSVLFYLKNHQTGNFFFIPLSGIMLAFGFLTKGFVSFFPWTFPFLLWMFLKHKSFWKMVTDSGWIILSTLVPLLFLITLSPVASESLHKYIDNQVVNSIRNVVTVDSRFDILKRLIEEITPAAGLCLVVILTGRFRKSPVVLEKAVYLKAFVFLTLVLTGVLPIMISMKQSGFYILPVYPFFSIGTGILMYPLLNDKMLRTNFESKGFLFFKWFSFGLFAVGILLSIIYSDGYSRDKFKIKDTKTIIEIIPKGEIINIYPKMYEDWSLHAYYARFKDISLDPDLHNRREYLLIKNEYYSDTLQYNYNPVKLNLQQYQLFKRK